MRCAICGSNDNWKKDEEGIDVPTSSDGTITNFQYGYIINVQLESEGNAVCGKCYNAMFEAVKEVIEVRKHKNEAWL